MRDPHLTLENFDRSFRDTLRYRHGLTHKDLEQTKEILGDAIEHVEHKTGTSSGLRARHLGTAIDFLNEKHKVWKRLPEQKKGRIIGALEEHFHVSTSE